MYCFIVKRQPPTFNSWKGASKEKKRIYKACIENSVNKYNEVSSLSSGDMYGLVFHFYNKNLKIDADNISKPLWDCLKGVLYEDDFQIKVRLAGSFDLSSNDFNILDFSGLNGDLIDEMLDALEHEEHVLYVECGSLKPSMYRFNFMGNGN